MDNNTKYWNKLENKNKPLEKFSYYFSLDTGQVHNVKFCRFVYTASSGSNIRLTLIKASNSVLQLFSWCLEGVSLRQRFLSTPFKQASRIWK